PALPLKGPLVLPLLLIATSCAGKQPPRPGPPSGNASIQARLLVNGLDQPVDLQAAPGDTDRLFIVQKTGAIRVFGGDSLVPRVFLDIASRVSNGSEQGLLGLAFHPQFQTNRRFYVDYPDRNGDTHAVQSL